MLLSTYVTVFMQTCTKPRSLPKLIEANKTSTKSLQVRGDASLEYFRSRFGLLLGKSRMAICETIYNLSYQLGHDRCFSSVGKLAEATGFTDRYVFKLVGQLEKLGFIEKVEVFNTADKKGTIFKLHLDPMPPQSDT